MIAIHYPAKFGKENFVKDLLKDGRILLAPYIYVETIATIPNITNFAIIENPNLKPQEEIVPILETSTKKENFICVEKFDAKIIVKAIDEFLLNQKNKLTKRIFNDETIIKSFEEVSIALTTERNHSKLLALILNKARELSSADAGSLYLVEKDGDGEKRNLRFALAQNDSKKVRFEEKVMPLSYQSIAGYVALTGEILKISDVYNLPSHLPYSHNKKFDEESGYKAKSMLVLPMRNSRGEIIGVLQLINKKIDFSQLLDSYEKIERYAVEFDEAVIKLMRSFSSIAAVAIENNQLIKSIEKLFEGMVEASVTAVEQRDPTTSGHSLRVSILTLSLAETINKVDEGKFKDIYFTKRELKELRYASILHDFGKIGVRENVLTKSKKLFPWQFESIMLRSEIARFSKEKENLLKIIEILRNRSRSNEEVENLFKEIEEYNKMMDQIIEIVIRSNEPTVLPEGDFSFLQKLSDIKYKNSKGEENFLFSKEEIAILSIPKGTLTEEERLEIESHVSYTYEFLKKIPWTDELKNIPSIAYAHHEKLNGEGYPRKITNSEIPFPSKLMAVSDIFDALSAADRPYKKAVPIEKTLDILKMEAKCGQLDIDVVNLFIEAKIYEKTLHLRQVSRG